MLNDTFYSLTLFLMHAGADDRRLDHYAALVEPIGLLADGVNYPKVKETFRLSNRELDVLQALMSGDKDKEIARVLGVTAGTIRAYLKSIRAKLRVKTRTAIVNRVHELSDEASASN
jgi:DNA-binding CsgD family transcriptional regulator